MAESMVIALELRNLQTVLSGLNRVQAAVRNLESKTATQSKDMWGEHAQFQTQIQKTVPKISAPKMPALPGAGTGKGGAPGLGSMLADLLPIAELAELANPVTAAIAAITGMVEATNAAAASLTAFREAMITSGGTAAETGRLSAYGAAVGVSNTASLARDLAERLASNGAAAGYGHDARISDNSSASSALDKASNLQRAIDHIVNLPHTQAGEQAAARFARVENLEMFLKLRDLSAQTRANLDDAARMSALAHNSEATKAAAEFNAQTALLSTNFDTISTSLGAALLPTMTDAVKLFNQLAPALNSAVIGLTPLIKLLVMATPIGALAELSRVIDMINKALENKPHTDAIDRNTKAHEDNTAALKGGVYGGGDRARGALPTAWGGANFKNWNGLPATLGAFNI